LRFNHQLLFIHFFVVLLVFVGFLLGTRSYWQLWALYNEFKKLTIYFSSRTSYFFYWSVKFKKVANGLLI